MSTLFAGNNSPVRGSAFTFSVSLVAAGAEIFQANPTLAAGDVKVSKDGSSFANIAALPTAIDAGVGLEVALTGTEMTADRIAVLFEDAAGDEWQSLLVYFETLTDQAEDLVDEVWDELQSGHTDAGSFGAYLDSKLSTIGAVVWASGTRTLTSFGTLAADVWAYGTRTLTSFGTLIADFWSYLTRTLTQGAASVISAVSGDEVTQYRDSTIYFTLTGLGDISTRTKLYFTVKDDADKDDDEAVLQLEETEGLLYLDGDDVDDLDDFTAADGTLTVNDEVTGSITVMVAAAGAAELTPGTYRYSMKEIKPADPKAYPVSEGTFVLERTGTKARS